MAVGAPGLLQRSARPLLAWRWREVRDLYVAGLREADAILFALRSAAVLPQDGGPEAGTQLNLSQHAGARALAGLR